MKKLLPIFIAILASSTLWLNQGGGHSVTQAVTQAQAQATQAPPTPIPLPTVTFSADALVIVQGDSVTLSWNVEGASEGRIQLSPAIPEINDPISAEASATISPRSTTTYRLEACNQAGCSSREVTVEVKVKPPLIRQFWADKSLLLQGDTATLTWNVDIEGTASVLFYLDHPAEGEEVPASSSKTVAPEHTATYRLRACNETDCDYKEITVVVNLKPPVVRCFKADPEVIDQGQSTTLRWEIEGVETGYLYPDTRGGGQVPAASWKTTPPLENTTVYKLEACNSAGCHSKEVTVIVNTAPQEARGSPQAGEQEAESTAPPGSQETPLASPTPKTEETPSSIPMILYVGAAIVALALFSLTALGVLYIVRQRPPVAPSPADSLPDDLERLWRQRTENKEEEP